MTDHDALLSAIVANPAEDTPRLAFADWLDENADTFPNPNGMHSRAAFIRDDIRLSQLGEFNPQRLHWEFVEKPRREAEPWVDAALPAAPPGCSFARAPLFRRGFPWAAVCEPHAGRIPDPPYHAFPLEGVRFRHCGAAGFDLLPTVPWAARLSAVEFERGTTQIINGDRRFPFDSVPALTRLTFLDDALTSAETRILLTTRAFSRVRALTFGRSAVGAAVAEELTRVGEAGALRELHLHACRVSAALLAALLDAPACDRLDALSLGGGGLFNSLEKFRVLGRIADPPPVRALDLSDETPSLPAVEWLVASSIIPGLCRLDLSRCSLNSIRVLPLAEGEFDNLRVLRLYGNSVGNDGAGAIARAPRLARLRVLDLGFGMVGDEGIHAILDSPLADGLVLLNLVGSPASAETKELLKERMGDRVRL